MLFKLMARKPPRMGARAAGTIKHGWATTSRTTRHQRGYGWQWEKQRARILDRDKHLCVACRAAGRAVIATDVDHIIPRSAGGSEDDSNLQSLCSACHKAKTAREGRKAGQ